MKQTYSGKKYNNENLIFVICGPSGVGKTNLKALILERHSDIKLCPSITTRPKRHSVHSIQEYHYINEDEYHRLYESGELITRKIRQFGFFYGIKPKDIIYILERGYHVLLETNLRGLKQLEQFFNNIVSIFISPPSITELKRRMNERKSEAAQEIGLRLNLAKKILFNFKEDMVTHCLVNEDLQISIEIIDLIINQEKLKLKNEPPNK